MKTYLITGGAGFIGSNFIKYLLEKYNEIKVITIDNLTYAGNINNLSFANNDNRHLFVCGDICDESLVLKLLTTYNIDCIVNFAAESHVDRSILSPDLFIRTNISGTYNLLNCAKKAWSVDDDVYKDGVKFIQISTDEVYGSLGEEGCFYETSLIEPHSPYAASKASADLIVKSYFDTYKLPANITRCSNNYGPNQHDEKLIPVLIKNALYGRNIPIYGDGLQIRDWIYVMDHCKAIDLVIEKGKIGEIYNVGSNNERTNIELAKYIINFLNKNVNCLITNELIKHVPDRKGHDRRYAIDANKIRTELGWEPETDFESGIISTIQWYMQKYNYITN